MTLSAFDPTTSALLEGVYHPEGPRSLFIDGKWEAARKGETRTIINPGTLDRVGEVSEASDADTEHAIAVARRTFDEGSWAATPASERGEILGRVADLISEYQEDFASAEAADTGKAWQESYGDMNDIIASFKYYAKMAGLEGGRVIDSGDPSIRSRTVVEPIGVCGLISPWNYPLLQVTWKVAPALAAGNTFVLKQAELTPHSAMMLMTVLTKAGVPAGVANLITGSGAACGNPLSQSPDVDLVSFTGGLETGRLVMRQAAETVKKVALELGGKNPNIIFADADFEAAVDNALNGAFLHSGQVCSAGARLVVEHSIHEEFVQALAERAQHIKLGSSLDPDTETGALISEQQRDKVHAYVERAREQGATIVCGGYIPTAEDNNGPHSTGNTDLTKGWYYLPTIIDDADASMDCVHDEAFGPVVTVETFSTVEEAIEIGNDTTYGLSGAVWTNDMQVAETVAAGLRHGTVWINDFGPYIPQAEWGGMKQSGVGRELGQAGLAEYQEIKHVYHNINPAVTGWFKDRR